MVNCARVRAHLADKIVVGFDILKKMSCLRIRAPYNRMRDVRYSHHVTSLIRRQGATSAPSEKAFLRELLVRVFPNERLYDLYDEARLILKMYERAAPPWEEAVSRLGSPDVPSALHQYGFVDLDTTEPCTLSASILEQFPRRSDSISNS